MQQREAAVAVACIAAAWGLIGILARWSTLPSEVVVSARSLLAAASIGAVALVRLGPQRAVGALRVPHAKRVVAVGLVLALHWWCLFGAYERAPIGTVLLITYLAPVLVAALAPRVLRERVPASTAVALGVALLGTLLLVRPERGQGTGVVLAILAALTFALLMLVSKQVVPDVGGIRLAFVQSAVAGTAVLPLALATDPGEPTWSWLWVVAIGVVFTGGLGSLYLVLLNRLPAATVAALSYVEPVAAVAFAWALLGEVPSATTVVGGTLVVAAGIMVIAATRSSAREGAPHAARR